MTHPMHLQRTASAILLLCASALTGHAQQESYQAEAVYITRPLIFSGFEGPKALKPAFSTASPTTMQEIRQLLTADTLPPTDYLWQRNEARRIAAHRMRYRLMLSNPDNISLAWKLPEPPSLRKTKVDTQDYLVSDLPLNLEDTGQPALIDDIRRINWFHKFDSGIQFSQAYLSPNWYQGGNNNLTLLVNLGWEVQLNEVYHPNILFTNSLSYKLGLYSTPQDTHHNYGISEDLFQWNMKLGLRASNKWFYSFTTMLKTQFINNYGENSDVRKASFLSPGELNLGLGMTYATVNKRGNFKFNTSLAPLSYNLKTCVDRHVDPTQFSIPAGKKYYNQVGLSAEITAQWDIIANISWKSRLFLFTNYKDFQGDWENTINFSINRFISTQIYLHMRYDTTAKGSANNWRYWMMKEILSFGFRYAFSTK